MPPEPTPTPLIDRLSEELNYPLLDLSNIDAFLAQHEHSVLFFTQDIVRFPESNDVAVVLPELITVFKTLVPAVIARKDEKKLNCKAYMVFAHGPHWYSCVVINTLMLLQVFKTGTTTYP